MAFIQFKGGELFVSDRAKFVFALLLALPVLGVVWSMIQENRERDARALQIGQEFCRTQEEVPRPRCEALLEQRHRDCVQDATESGSRTSSAHFRRGYYTRCLLEGTTYERLRKKGVMGP